MPGEDTHEGKVGTWIFVFPAGSLRFRADAIKSSVPENTVVTKKDQKGAGFKTLLSLLKIINVRTQDEFCEAEECRWNAFISCTGHFSLSPMSPPCSAPFPKASEDPMLPPQPSLPEHTFLKKYTQSQAILNVPLPSNQNLPVLRCVSSLLSLRQRDLGPSIILPRNKLEFYRSFFKSEWLSPKMWF